MSILKVIVGANYPMQKVLHSCYDPSFNVDKNVTMNQEEIWKDIQRFGGYYMASACGKFKRTDKPRVDANGITRVYKERLLNPSKTKKGYLRFYVSINNKSIGQFAHKLIAETFIPNPKNLPEVNHRNGDKADNRIENLEWCTHKENMEHAWENGLCKALSGENNGMSKFTNNQVPEIRRKLNSGQSGASIARQYGVSRATISYIKLGKTWKHI